MCSSRATGHFNEHIPMTPSVQVWTEGVIGIFYQKLDGSFANHSVISGTASGDSVTFNCSLGINTQSNARTGSWTGQLTS
jgi:hypothetical protein